MANNTPLTIQIFCAKCQEDTAHTGAVDLNGELVFSCDVCGGFLKLPAPKVSGMTAADIHAYFAEHKIANEGQVSIQDSIDILGEVMTPEQQ